MWFDCQLPTILRMQFYFTCRKSGIKHGIRSWALPIFTVLVEEYLVSLYIITILRWEFISCGSSKSLPWGLKQADDGVRSNTTIKLAAFLGVRPRGSQKCAFRPLHDKKLNYGTSPDCEKDKYKLLTTHAGLSYVVTHVFLLDCLASSSPPLHAGEKNKRPR